MVFTRACIVNGLRTPGRASRPHLPPVSNGVAPSLAPLAIRRSCPAKLPLLTLWALIRFASVGENRTIP